MALALGIGANTAIFSVVNAVLIRSLPFRDPDRLVMVWENNRVRGKDQNVISPANYLDWQDQNTVFDRMAALYDYRANLTGVDDPEELATQVVSANFFDLLGVNAVIGRTFVREEGVDGRDSVVVLGFGLWKRRFGGDPAIAGRTIKLNGHDVAVIGVAPPDFQFLIKQGSLTGKQAELWLPLAKHHSGRAVAGRPARARFAGSPRQSPRHDGGPAPRGTLRPGVGRRAHDNGARTAERPGVRQEECGELYGIGEIGLSVSEQWKRKKGSIANLVIR